MVKQLSVNCRTPSQLLVALSSAAEHPLAMIVGVVFDKLGDVPERVASF